MSGNKKQLELFESSKPYPKLPSGWNWTVLGDFLSDIQAGKSFKCLERPPHNSEVGIVKVSAVTWGTFRELESKTCTRPELVRDDYFIKPGDFLFSRANTIELVGACVIVGPVHRMLMLSDKILRFTFEAIDPRWALWALRTVHGRSEIRRLATGNQQSMRNISQARIRQIHIPLAPRIEHLRIVSSIEEQMSKLDGAVAGLQRVQANLERYRASVLKAAVESRLVPTDAALARAEGRDYEPASVLLERILTERRQRWEQAELAKMKAKGKMPKNDKWKPDTRSPPPPDTHNLPALPEGWCWAYFDSFLHSIQAGKNLKCEERPPIGNEVGVVKVSAVTWGEFDESESKTCRNPSFVNQRLFIKPRDFLFSRANTLQLVGTCVIVGKVSRKLMLSDKILRFQTIGEINRWLLMVLRSTWGRSEIEALATGNQESMRNIGQARIRQIQMPLPPLHEIRNILSEAELHLATAQRINLLGHTNLIRSERLRQSILKWAFEGKLVDQNPNDEPASELLARIRAQRQAAEAARPKRRTRQRKKKTAKP